MDRVGVALRCAVVGCGHEAADHGQERAFYECGDSRREVCLACEGYVTDDDQSLYPRGRAWHRFKPAIEQADTEQGGVGGGGNE